MPTIGKPDTFQNKFSNISMHRGKVSPKDLKQPGDILNKLSGRGKNGVKYVDRSKHNVLGKNEFIKLLAHQIANQDPFKPMDQKKFTGELAQMSQLEQLSNINESLKKDKDIVNVANKFYSASFLGKKVTTAGTSLNYDGKTSSTELPFYLSKNAKNVMLRIFDSKNQLIAQIEKENMPMGDNKILWDGTRLDKVRAAKGKYTVQVKAWDNLMDEFNGETKTFGVVTGVSFKNGEALLKIDGEKIVFLGAN